MSSLDSEPTKTRFVQVDEERAGQRLDNFLFTELKGLPRSLVYRLMRTGQVRVNKGRVKAAYRLCHGDQVRLPPVRLPEVRDKGTAPQWQQKALVSAVVYEDSRLLVINKPAGMAVHGGSGVGFGVIETLREMRPGDPYLELVHRLDRDTSGCLLLSKRRSMLRWLHQLIRENRIEKRYLALLAGKWQKKSLRVDAPLRKNTLKSGERVVRVDHEGKLSRTDFRRLRTFPTATLVQARLHSGRTHQIRVHAAHMGSPILGDLKYGDRDANQKARGLGLKRLFLHAFALTFELPDGAGRLELQAPLDSELEGFLDDIGAAH